MQRKKRLFDHVVLHVKDIDESKKFYRAIVEILGHTITGESADHFYINELEIRQNQQTTKSAHLAFHAENPALVKLFHDTALRFGGRCLETPGQKCGKGIYTAHVMDPDGNDIEAIYKDGRENAASISY
jgi:predicted lactoylglutathione lyase